MTRRIPTVLLLLAGLVVPAARASCGVPWLFASAEHGNANTYSYVYTPGVNPATSTSGYSVTEDFEGFFWALGFGDPAPGLGHDNGSWSGDGDPGWFWLTPGFPALLLGTWAQSNEIDGCISEAPLPRGEVCMAILLTDQAEDVGYFAALTRKSVASTVHDYEFLLPDNAPFVLAPIPPPQILAEQRVGPVDFAVTVAPPLLDGGLYLQPECNEQGAMPIGYRIYSQTLPAEAPGPADRAVAAGWGEPTRVVDLDADAVLTVPCDDDRVTWLGTTLVFDSGFETPVVSENSAPIACRRCELGADADGDGFCTEEANGGFADCDDTDPSVYPRAPQRCDGIDNDCLNPEWPTPPAGEADGDADGFRQCDGDCADGDPSRWPGAVESCNDLDDDCDGLVDEDANGADSDGDGIANACDNCAAVTNQGQEDVDADGRGDACDDCTDRDGDGWGSPGSAACVAGAAEDCDDLDWVTLPGGVEYDDGKDNDCDLTIDEGLDADGDGVPGFRDACPDTPPNAGVDSSGCDVCPVPALDDPTGRKRFRTRVRDVADPPAESARRP